MNQKITLPEKRSFIEKFRKNGDVQGLIKLLREHEDPCLRLFATKMLGKMGDAAAVPALLDSISDMKRCCIGIVSIAAKEALITIGSPGIEPLILALRSDKNDVRRAAADVLGKIGDPRAVEPLIAEVREKGNEMAVMALARLADTRAVEPLIEILKSSRFSLRNEVALALGEIGDERAVEPLNMILKEKDDDNYLAVERALRNIHDPEVKRRRVNCIILRQVFAEALEDSRNLEALKLLVSAVGDADSQVRTTAMRALVRIAAPAVGLLVEALDNRYTRHYARRVLGCIGTPAVEPLIAALKSEDSDVQDYAAIALGEIGDLRAVEPLMSMKDENGRLFKYAAYALGEIGDPVAVEPLIQSLKDEKLRKTAAEALGFIGDTRAIEPLLPLLRDENTEMTAAEALCNIGSQAVEPLIAMLKEENIRARRRAAWCLGDINDARAAEPLIEALKDASVSKEAGDALGRIHNPGSVEPLLKALLKEKNKHNSWIFASALFRCGWRPDKSDAGAAYWIAEKVCERCEEIGAPAVERLILLLKDRDERIRVSAIKTLGKIGDLRAVKPLVTALNDKSRFVQREAVDALGKLGWKPEKPEHVKITAYYNKRKEEKDPQVDEGESQLERGIYLNLEGKDPQEADRLFEQTAENCRLTEDYIDGNIIYHNYDDIALGYLYRGYALLNLGRYAEAYGDLTKVVPYLDMMKKSGGEMWRTREYALSKALVQLCEYKLDHSQENLQKAKQGIEKYIKSLRKKGDKEIGQHYYDHLQKKFADVYSAEVAPEKGEGVPKIEKPAVKVELPPGEYGEEGSVIIFDREGSGSLEVFGSNNEFEAYVEKVKTLGNFPVLSNLMELYATEGLQEPEPLIEECERLLSRIDVEPEMKEKASLILIVARDAKEADSTVMLYFDPEV